MRLKQFVLSGVLLIVSNVCVAGQEIFLTANQHYEKQEYQQALDLYESIARKGRAVWYNMGNCNYKLDHLTDARVCWRRSQNCATSLESEDIAYNIDVVQNRIGTMRQSCSTDSLRSYAKTWSMLGLQLLFLVLWIQFFLLGALYRTYGRAIILSSLLCGTAFTGTLIRFKYKALRARTAVVADSSLTLFAGPHSGFHNVGSVPQAAEVCLLDERDDWCKICYNGTVGWATRTALSVV